MNDKPLMNDTTARYFLSYSSVKLPLKLVNEITEADLNYRNFYYRGYYDAAGQLLHCQKIVYNEEASEHHYRYDENGMLVWAQISEDDEVREIDL
ncbi:DUF6156 family protein [Methylovulum sp.]|uniref:DUF6156 family protein n=1 Tax=Methylovulum sp. TaxID=1916980 RepID=UPI0026017C8B|nr:DUF6156 family protein [Methylovulum sp.]MDD5124855.1 DUF6156 family protein [Methylovulum sp.]